MLEIAIFEDNREYLEHLCKAVAESLRELKIPGKIVCPADTPGKFEDYLKSGAANVCFLDITYKNKPVGLELAKRIRELFSHAYIVFITEFQHYAFESIPLHPFEFLKKPVSVDEIKNCLLSVYRDYLEKPGPGGESKISVKSGTSTYVLRRGEIVMIERLLGKTIIHTPYKQISCYNALDYFEKFFENDNNFIRCHKSFIANKKYISEIHCREIIFSTGHCCGIGKKYKGELI